MIANLSDQLDEILQVNGENLKLRAITAFDQLAKPFEKNIILFGAGNLGRRTLIGLHKIGIEPLAFADNNPKIWGSNVEGVQVLNPREAVERYGEKATFVLTILSDTFGHPLEALKTQLNSYGPVKVISFAFLYWKYAETFLPYFCLDLPNKVLDQFENVHAAAQLWSDDASRTEYLAQVKWRLSMDFTVLPGPVSHRPYLPLDLFSLNKDTVFVDCGAFDGDTIRDFLQAQNSNFRKIIAFEPDQSSFSKLEKYIDTLPQHISKKITLYSLALGERREKVLFDASGTMQSSVINSGNTEVESIPLDEILANIAPTFVKMDIEGTEAKALSGMKITIMEKSPILAISVYHQIDHLWSLPLMIHSLSDKYRFFLRPHGAAVLDLVCYAIPYDRLIKEQ
jgi:FkbM family methyltransferase